MDFKITKQDSGLSFLSEKELEDNADVLTRYDWQSISLHINKFSYEFIEKFQDQLDWNYVNKNRTLSGDFIRKFHSRMDWRIISAQQKMTEELLEEFKDKINWDVVSASQNLSDNFIRKYADKLDWNGISTNQNLSETIINEFSDRIIWSSLSCNFKTSEGIIAKFLDKLDLDVFISSRFGSIAKLSEDTILKILKHNKSKDIFHDIMLYNKVSENIIRDNIDLVADSTWNIISEKQNLSIKFVSDFKDKIRFVNLAKSNHLTFEMINAFKKEFAPFFSFLLNNHSKEIENFFEKCLMEKIGLSKEEINGKRTKIMDSNSDNTFHLFLK